MGFMEIKFPDKIAYGSSFGPAWRTDVTRVASGFETRDSKWAHPLYMGDVSSGIKEEADMQAIIDFFHQARGRAYGFRFKDWGDFEATDQVLLPDGGPTVQLRKSYAPGASNEYVRTITKPVDGTVSLSRNGSAFTDYTLDTTTGEITLDADSTASIDDIARDSSGTVTAPGHGFSDDDEIYIDGVNGMTEVNGEVYTITVVDADTFTLGTDTSGYDEYTSGGTAYKYVQSSESLTWSGEFDVPVRFDTDELSVVFEDYQIQSTSVPVVEIRIR